MDILLAILLLLNGLLLGAGSTFFLLDRNARRRALEDLLAERTRVTDALATVVATVNPLIDDVRNLRERVGITEMRSAQTRNTPQHNVRT